MSKSTWILIPDGREACLRRWLSEVGLLLGDAPAVRLGNDHFLDLTQGHDDTGNGFADGERFERRQREIARRAERHAAAGWSAAKVAAWQLQMEENELQPMLRGAAGWQLRLQGLMSHCHLHVVTVVAMLNSDSVALVPFPRSEPRSLGQLTPEDIVRLSQGVMHKFVV